MPPTDYSKASIYKIVCEDQRFYIGSTVLPLAIRFGQHRRAVNDGVNNSKVYRHIRSLGGPDKATIHLVASNLGVTTRDELLKIEDAFIRVALKNKLCLNRNKPRATSEERRARKKLQSRMWTKVSKDIRHAEEGSAPTLTLAERVRAYYREHKRLPKYRKKVDPEELIGCECGLDLIRAQLIGHRKTKAHMLDLAKWRVRKQSSSAPL